MVLRYEDFCKENEEDVLADAVNSALQHCTHSIERVLEDACPNLKFYVDRYGGIHYWLKVEGEPREGFKMNKDCTIHNISQYASVLLGLSKKFDKIAAEPDKWFCCTECMRVLPREEFADSVFAGWYCKECAEKPEIEALLKESHRPGFYD